MNGLKWLNDNLGYDMGNKAIQQTCELIRKHISDDYIYRINGDEFVIIWPGVSYSQFMETAEKLKSTLSSKQNIAAVGYVWGSEEDVGITVRKAEKAMQAAKINSIRSMRIAETNGQPIWMRFCRSSGKAPLCHTSSRYTASRKIVFTVRKFSCAKSIHEAISTRRSNLSALWNVST